MKNPLKHPFCKVREMCSPPLFQRGGWEGLKIKKMIGIFDSGLGGLTILKYILKELPEYDYLYLGDTARTPYGGRSQEIIYQYTKEAVDFLFSQGADLIIVACNTASSQALRKIQQEYLPSKYPGKNVLGVIRPLAEAVISQKNLKKIGVVGTKATINSNVYAMELSKLKNNLEVFQVSAPLLVPLIEEGWSKKKETKMILKKYVRRLKEKKVDALILGCTHYPFLLKQFQTVMPKKCFVPNPGVVVAQSLKNYLIKHPEYAASSGKSLRKYFTTDDVLMFKKLGEKFLGGDMGEVKKITL